MDNYLFFFNNIQLIHFQPDSEEVIKILNEANIRTIMVTGDNILTAVSVAKDCDMVTDKQSIIIVNSRLAASGEYELFYTLEGHSTTATATNNNQLMSPPSICEFEGIEGEVEGGDSKYKLMVNSHSASSLETLETNTHSPMAQKVIKDLETGGKLFNGNQKKLMNEEEDYNPYKLAPELPSNRYRFAMDGKTFAIVKEYFPDLMPKFTTRGSIFARMSPDQKQALITELQGLGYYVAMCGDGSNDCG